MQTAAAGAAAMPSGPAPYKFDSLAPTQRYVLADEWGFDLVGESLPAGLDPEVLQRAIPSEAYHHDTKRALQGLLLPLALMSLGYGWLWYMHSIIPVWQQLICWLTIGTGYAGLFNLAHECARGSLLPNNPSCQAILGTILMAPSLYSLETWRARVYHHFFEVNTLSIDVTAWHPLTVEELLEASPLQRKLLRLIATTPLKMLASIGDLARSLQHWDLKTYYELARPSVIAGWAAPLAFFGLGLPCMVAAGGMSGLVNWWLAPWLVFHAWLSTLTRLQHTAPHIPFRPEGVSGQDLCTAIVSGTVTIRLPSWLEAVLNYPNYHMPQHLAPDDVPYYNAKRATEGLRERLWPYMTEGKLSVKLLVNHITKWQVYDTEQETYITFDEAMQKVTSLEQQQEGAAPAASS